ncbi:MAG: GTPase HflX [Actinomycetia bacterium]|nr:GTPase HflX [Actinomycetes bacterium]
MEPQEKAILVGIKLPYQTLDQVKESLKELANLALTSGAEVLGELVQIRNRYDSRYLIGLGKVEELAETVNVLNANMVIFDDELTSSQQDKLNRKIGVKVIDRTALILDIFSQHANSYEGKLQVELAQLNYLLPRLKGRGIEMSRLGGGIGTRGPGETKLEYDRRRMQKRINSLKKEINNLKVHREVQRHGRKRKKIPLVSLVGYTNSGKSTLLNLLCNANVEVNNKLFVTLDTIIRRRELEGGRVILFSDTVGFIRKLPHQIVASFRSTLEEVKQADILLHIIDSNHPNMEEQIETVNKVLEEIGAKNNNILMVFNKIDLLERLELNRLKRKYPEGVFISALKGDGINNLFNGIIEIIDRNTVEIIVSIPYKNSNIISYLHELGEVKEEKYLEDSIKVKVLIPKHSLQKIESLSIDKIIVAN